MGQVPCFPTMNQSNLFREDLSTICIICGLATRVLRLSIKDNFINFKNQGSTLLNLKGHNWMHFAHRPLFTVRLNFNSINFKT